jgi:polysaccharide export outer membrane protein
MGGILPMNRAFLCNLLVCAILLDCAAPAGAQATPRGTQATAASAQPAQAAAPFMPVYGVGTLGRNYRIASGDSLVISVLPAQEFSRSTMVQPDGNIELPIVGLVIARGLTTEELTQELVDKLSRFVANPQVTVSVSAFGAKTITAMGEIASSSYEYKDGMGMLELIGRAGGIRDTTRIDRIIIFRKTGTGFKRMFVDFRPVFNDGDMTKDIPLQAGDIIYFPTRSLPKSSRWLTDNFGGWIGVLTLAITTALLISVTRGGPSSF